MFVLGLEWPFQPDTVNWQTCHFGAKLVMSLLTMEHDGEQTHELDFLKRLFFIVGHFIYVFIYFNRSHFWQDCSVHASLWCVSNWEAIHFHLTAIFTSWILVDYMYLVSQLPPNHVNSKRRFCVDCVCPYAENERTFFYFASPLTACNPEFSAYLTFKLMTTVLLFFYFIFLTFCQTFISKRF